MRNASFRFIAAGRLLFSTSLLSAQGKGFDTKRMDTTVEACNDFFQYANGTWLKIDRDPCIGIAMGHIQHPRRQ